jgi:hypothetical protein
MNFCHSFGFPFCSPLRCASASARPTVYELAIRRYIAIFWRILVTTRAVSFLSAPALHVLPPRAWLQVLRVPASAVKALAATWARFVSIVAEVIQISTWRDGSNMMLVRYAVDAPGFYASIYYNLHHAISALVELSCPGPAPLGGSRASAGCQPFADWPTRSLVHRFSIAGGCHV